MRGKRGRERKREGEGEGGIYMYGGRERVSE